MDVPLVRRLAGRWTSGPNHTGEQETDRCTPRPHIERRIGCLASAVGEEPFLRDEISKARRGRWWSLLSRFAVSICIYLLRNLFGLKRSPPKDPQRDRLEGDLLDDAISRRIPVIGICRVCSLSTSIVVAACISTWLNSMEKPPIRIRCCHTK